MTCPIGFLMCSILIGLFLLKFYIFLDLWKICFQKHIEAGQFLFLVSNNLINNCSFIQLFLGFVTTVTTKFHNIFAHFKGLVFFLNQNLIGSFHWLQDNAKLNIFCYKWQVYGFNDFTALFAQILFLRVFVLFFVVVWRTLGNGRSQLLPMEV